MKIFNWVHRRFNNKAENAKKNDDVSAEDQQFPDENKCNDVYESWRGGILAIGTFGYDPLKEEEIQQLDDYLDDDEDSFQKHQCGDETTDVSDEEDVEMEEEEKNPFVLAACSDNAEDELGLTQVEMEENWSHEFEYVMMKKKERTTLADLFYSDPQDEEVVVKKKKKKIVNKTELVKEKPNCKQTLSFGKKMIGKDARPIHKLNQLMRRMMKRKIHPDAGAINSKVAGVNNKCRATDDYASLLSTQGAKECQV